MKKFLMTLVAVLYCVNLFTSCEKGESDKPTAKDTTPSHVVMDYALSVTDDIFNACTLTVEYYDADGTKKTETMTSKEWTKFVKPTKLPATMGASLFIKLKEGFDSSKDALFDARHLYGYNYYLVNKSYEKLQEEKTYGVSSGTTMSYGIVPAYVERYQEKPFVSFLLKFAADGTISPQ